MLDLDHPMSRFIVAVAREDDAILSIARRMTLVSTEAKRELLESANPHFTRMRELQREGWGESTEQTAAIVLLKQQLTHLAEIPSENDFYPYRQGKNCTVCSRPIENLKDYPDMVYCHACIAKIDSGREAVDEAFGLFAI
ncbi:hypothetical protein Pan97_20220 [Bremerella volcania]|uniref:Uncharacterized protein n=1 Tax=Bremerella volcania TaxID=2527984 RepID=A0A518C723_9BACT|nr:hypothetical protein [Bremerella volcania]QDU75002.1 hypothetical protein Pan97_20220 [Bremerella volcania]